PDRVPLFELGINPHIVEHLGGDTFDAMAKLGLDMFPVWLAGLPDAQVEHRDDGSWVDEFGRLWRHDPAPRTHGSYYVGGMVDSRETLQRYLPPVRATERLVAEGVAALQTRYPDHALTFMFHGPFELTYEGMGTERFCWMMYDDRALVREALERHTDWYIALAQRAVELGMEYIIIGDDSAFKQSSFISPRDFAALVIPCYERIVRSVPVPAMWHSDGNVMGLLPLIIEAGIVGVHPLEPVAGMDMAAVKREFGRDLVLIGNCCVSTVLTTTDFDLVHRDVDRCMAQAKAGGGYIFASSNSLHGGVEPTSAVEAFRYAAEVGAY
ncbi:MAG: hypothetical protein FJX74_04390, partial [Armatimonadetes bacterium]|nr:hypothetical protein [Armatimonadota bacterium]